MSRPVRRLMQECAVVCLAIIECCFMRHVDDVLAGFIAGMSPSSLNFDIATVQASVCGQMRIPRRL